MVRCGRVAHPREWEWVGYREIIGERRRYRLIDLDKLCWRSKTDDIEALRLNLQASLMERLARDAAGRERCWTESLAVGIVDLRVQTHFLSTPFAHPLWTAPKPDLNFFIFFTFFVRNWDRRQLLSEVNTQTDQQLLREYAAHRSDDAITELVGRHYDLVQRNMAASGGQYPTQIEQLAPYFDPPLDPAMLVRWRVVAVKEDDVEETKSGLIIRLTPVDPQRDTQWAVDENGPRSARMKAKLRE